MGVALMTGIGIRECRLEDLPTVAELLRELGEYASSHAELSIDDLSAMLTEMLDAPEFYANYVAVWDTKVVGFLSMVFYKTMFHRGGTALINELVVVSDCRKQGIGRLLLARAVSEARLRGMDEIEVGTEFGNKGAQAFYHKQGFTEEYLLLGMEFE